MVAAETDGDLVLLVWVVASIVFAAIRLVPGDPAELLLSQGGAAPDPAIVAQLHDQLGLNKPFLVQYVGSFRDLLSGDLGQSLQDQTPVADEIMVRLPRTLELILAATMIGVLSGIPAGTMAAAWRGGWFDRSASFVAAVSLAVPVFVVGTLLVLMFAQTLRWVPAGGYVPLAQAPGRHLLLLAMPAVTIGIGLGAAVFRMTRASVLDVTAARLRAHGARQGAASAARAAAPRAAQRADAGGDGARRCNMGTLLGGTVLVEYVFNCPGLSGMLVGCGRTPATIRRWGDRAGRSPSCSWRSIWWSICCTPCSIRACATA